MIKKCFLLFCVAPVIALRAGAQNTFPVTGNVGIGTLSPSAQLDVNGHIVISHADPYLRTNTNDKHLVLSGGSGWVATGSTIVLRGNASTFNTYGMEIYSGGSMRMLINSGGSVGIGTYTPSSLLDVNGHITISNNDPYLRTNTTDKYLVLSGGNGWTATGSTLVLRGSTSPTNTHGMEIYTGNKMSMLINSGGSVGVGTGTPTSLLDVNGYITISYSDPYLRTNTTDKHLVLSGGNGWTATGAVIVLRGASTVANPHGMELYAGGTNRMNIYANGAITMGAVSSTPAGYKLFVEQGILSEKVKVAIKTTADWSDHVFNKNYPLMPLQQVEQFIQTNGHLPGIPSATEVVKEGIDLGKMNAKLLEKIEELTLYMLNLHKNAETQQKEIAALKAQLQKQTGNR